jgi:hypothetical protein
VQFDGLINEYIDLKGTIWTTTKISETTVTENALYRSADKSLAHPTSRCILFDGDNISFDVSLVIYIYIYIYIERERERALIFLQL